MDRPGTGFPYPLPLHLIPSNAWSLLQTVKMYHGSGRRREIREWRIKNHIHGRFPFADSWRPDRIHLSPALKELDWPMDVPDNVIPCGPILLPVASVKDQDHGLDTWLQNAPTILVNLGTLYAPDPNVARELASGLKGFLDQWEDNTTQILWKLPRHPYDKGDIYQSAIEPLRKETRDDRVRIQPWFEVEPMAMLKTGQIVCSVHHGGANSWYEAIQTGVPHVILPAWQDCYENAARAEWIGIGVYGNKSKAPDVNGKELCRALLKVMGNDSYREKAAVLQEKCRVPGRVVGCEKLVELLHHPEQMNMNMPQFEEKEVSQVTNRAGKTVEIVPAKETPGKQSKSPTRSIAETLIVALLCNAWLILPTLSYALLLVPRLRLLVLVYTLYVKIWANPHITGQLSLRSDSFRTSWVWQLYTSYFPLTLYRTTPLPPQKKYIFGYHPHGIALRGALGALASDTAGFSHLFPGITNTLLMKDDAFRTPLLREYLLASGLGGVSRSSCIKHLVRGGHDGRGMGRAITITVGGSREYAIARPGTMGVVIRIRKGFIRVAVETGAEIVPVIAFGENELFVPVDVSASLLKKGIARIWQAFVGHAVSFATGRFGMFIPHRHPLRVVVGEPIPVQQQRWEQDEKYINALQGRYIDELRRLYDDWKGVFGDSAIRFEIVG